MQYMFSLPSYSHLSNLILLQSIYQKETYNQKDITTHKTTYINSQHKQK